MRSIKELLIVLLENKKLFRYGLCRWSSDLFYDNIISYEECMLLRQYIDNNRPKNDFIDKLCTIGRNNDAFYWTEGLLYPRVRWIKQQIKKLEGGTTI